MTYAVAFDGTGRNDIWDKRSDVLAVYAMTGAAVLGIRAFYGRRSHRDNHNHIRLIDALYDNPGRKQSRRIELLRHLADSLADEGRIASALVVFPTNQGAAIATNYCRDLARGEFIAVLNSDDVFMPDKLAMQDAIDRRRFNIGPPRIGGRPIQQKRGWLPSRPLIPRRPNSRSGDSTTSSTVSAAAMGQAA